MKLSEYARINSCTYRTAWNRYKAGKIKCRIDDTGHVIVFSQKEQKPSYIVTYARVSSSENKDNLETQSKRLIDYCNANGWKTHENIKEVGSGLNDKRKKLLKILSKGKATKIVVEHKDRLARFGVSYIETICKHIGCDLHIINNSDTDKEDLVQDFVSVITSFCARLYGQRRNRRRTEELIKTLEYDTSKII